MSNICFLSVGNKNDCPEKKVVQTEDAQKFADEIGIQLYETSAQENLNVQEVGI
jgi:Ras-related protein Rab-35